MSKGKRNEENNQSEILSFNKLKNQFKVKLNEDDRGKSSYLKQKKHNQNQQYQDFYNLNKILDFSFFPLFSFEPQTDILNIYQITSRKQRNKELKRTKQKESLIQSELMKNTFYQCYEPLSVVFSYLPNFNYIDFNIISINEELFAYFQNMLQPDEKTSNIYSMPSFMAYFVNFAKIRMNHKLNHGIMAKKLNHSPSTPIVEKPLSNYVKSYYQMIILSKLSSNPIDVKKITHFFLEMESNAMTILEYRFYLISHYKWISDRMKQFYHDIDNADLFYHRFLFYHPVFYRGDHGCGFLSCRWLLPLNINTAFSGVNITNYLPVDIDSIRVQNHPSVILKKNFNVGNNSTSKNNSEAIEKQFELYDINNIHFKELKIIDLDLSSHDVDIKNDFDDEGIYFHPSLDFDDKKISLKIRASEANYDINHASNNFMLLNHLLENRKKLEHSIFEINKRKKFFSKTKNANQMNYLTVFNDFRYSENLKDTKNTFSKQYSRRLMINEILHQWCRDMVSIHFMEHYVIMFNEKNEHLNDELLNHHLSFIFNNLISNIMTNEFDRIHLDLDYVSGILSSQITPIKRSISNVPITIDEIMYEYFLFLSKIYSYINIGTLINDLFLSSYTNIAFIVDEIQKIPPSIIIKWISVWLLVENIPHEDGYYQSNLHEYDFNVKMLPILYEYGCLPLRRDHQLDLTQFEKKTSSNMNYIWNNNSNTVKNNFKFNLDFFMNQQIELCKLLFYKNFYLITNQIQNNIVNHTFNNNRYYIFPNIAYQNLNDFNLINSSVYFNIKMNENYFFIDGINFDKLIYQLNPLKYPDRTETITNIQNKIDFYLSCMNQFNNFMSYLIIFGNNFIDHQLINRISNSSLNGKTKSAMEKMKSGARFVNISSLNVDNDDTIVMNDQFYIEDVFSIQENDHSIMPEWLYIYNPNIKMYQERNASLKIELNRFRRPDNTQLQYISNMVLEYTYEKNETIPEMIKIINKMISIMRNMIVHDMDIDQRAAKEKKQELNVLLNEFIFSYVTDPLPNNLIVSNLSLQGFQNYILSKERFSVKKDLGNNNNRKKKILRLLFIKEFINTQYETVNETYTILRIINIDTVGLDTTNILHRLEHAIENIDNTINHGISMSIYKNDEVIARHISLEKIRRDDFIRYLIQKKTIITLRNMRYLFRSHVNGIRYFLTNDEAIPKIKEEWKATVMTISGKTSHTEIIHNIKKINVAQSDSAISDVLDIKNESTIFLPFFSSDMTNFIKNNRECVLYIDLKLFLLRPNPSSYPEEDQREMVVYHPFSLLGSQISIFDNDDNILNIVKGNLYQRMQRFNNFVFLNQPQELLFFHGKIIQEFY